MITVTVPVLTVSPNRTSGEHWSKRCKRSKGQRSVSYLCLMRTEPIAPKLPVVVTLTRLSAGTLDGHDNLRQALKPVADGIADYLQENDADPHIEWRYAQERCKRGVYGVRIEID